MATMQILSNTMASVTLHGKFVLKPAATSMEHHRNTMVTMEILWNTMASVVLHGNFIWKHAVTSMENHGLHGIPMEHHDPPYKLHRFSMEKPWWISVRGISDAISPTIV